VRGTQRGFDAGKKNRQGKSTDRVVVSQRVSSEAR
jgi:hypothetical protein